MAREIEVRFKLAEEQRVLFLRWVEDNATFAGETHHIEHYLDNPLRSFIFENINGFKDSEQYLRVRFDDKKGDSVCLKIFKIDQEKQTSENLSETEFSVDSGEQALALFKLLGYSKATIIDKTRKKYFTNDQQHEICLDEVKGLGSFVEVELLASIDGDIEIGFRQLYSFLKSIGITQIDEQHRGYVTMLWNPELNFGKIRTL